MIPSVGHNKSTRSFGFYGELIDLFRVSTRQNSKFRGEFIDIPGSGRLPCPGDLHGGRPAQIHPAQQIIDTGGF